MTALALSGWLAAGLLAGVVAAVRGSRRACLHRIAEAEHELRGPLTALGLALEARGEGLGPGEVRGLRAELVRARCALADLTAARNGARPPATVVRAVDLGGVAHRSVSAWRPAAIAAGVDLEIVCSVPLPVLGDPGRLAQAAGNLIANAIEHGGGCVRVRGTHRGGHASLEVADAGPGVTLRSARRRRGHGGRRGHGLRVAARVAAAHGGRLEFSPACPRGAGGASVVLTVPLRDAT